MVAFATMLAGVVLFFIFLFSSPDLFDTAEKQTLWCLFPPMALQVTRAHTHAPSLNKKEEEEKNKSILTRIITIFVNNNKTRNKQMNN